MTTTPVAEGVGLFTNGSTFNIPTGTDRVRTSGYRNVGQGSADYFRWSSALPSLPAVATGENAWWFTDANGAKWYPDPAALHFDQFGAYFDGTSDDLAAFKAFRSFALWARFSVDFAYAAVPRLTMPSGIGYSSDTWDFDFGTVHLFGEPGAQNGGRGCSIKFAAGKTGIRVHAWNTTGTTSRSDAPGATGSTFYGIDVWTDGAGGTTDADGWRIRVTCSLIGCSAWNFVRHGVNATATAGGGSSVEGNDNLLRIEGGNFHHNGGAGVFLDGADANAGTVKDVNCSANGVWGIWDSSFLGNTIISCHTELNGVETAGPTYAPSTVGTLCSYGGNRYWCGNPGAASTTVPGTNSNVWAPMGPGGAHPIFPTWTSGKAFIRGGPYFVEEASARSVLIGCYSESGQAPSALSFCAQAIGGLHGAGIDGAFLDMDGGRFTVRRKLGFRGTRTTGESTEFYIGANNQPELDAGILATFGSSTAGSFEQRLKMNTEGTLYTDYLNGGGTTYWALLGPNSTLTGGRSSGQPYRFYAVEMFLGMNTANARAITYDSAAPTSGNHAAGEIVFNCSPTAGGKVGWVCTTTGTPGTWKAFGAIDL